MINRYFLVLFLMCLGVTLHAQQTSYHEMHCLGLIPDDFLPDGAKNLMLDNVDEQIKSKRDTKLFAKFNLKSNYSAYNCLVSGYVIYGTPLNDYINKVADKLLEKDPETRKKIRIYLFESSQVNAFTFSNGLILVNLGLFAKLNSEAELAFVLAHEVAHYTRSHAFNAFRKERTFDKESKEVALSIDRDEIDYYRFSKEQETEADNLGFVTFMNSGYKIMSSISLLDVLARANWPISNKQLTRDFLNSKYLKIPLKYFNDTTVKANSIDSSKTDKNQTHPAIPKRKQALINLMLKNFADTSIGKLYLVSQDKFEKLRAACRLEMPRLYLHDKEYLNSFYASYALLGTGNDEYLTSQLVKNLYFIQFNYNAWNRSDVIESVKKSEGEVSRLNYMLVNMSKDELNAWCIRKAWDYASMYPNNQEIELFTKGITKGFKENVAQELSFFAPLNEYNDSLIESFYTSTLSEDIAKQKKANSDKKSNRIRVKKTGSFVKYTMPDYLTNEKFRLVFESIEVKKASEEEEENTRVKINRNRRKDKLEHFKADQIILANFTNIKLNERRKSDPVMYAAMTEQTEEFIGMIKQCASLNNVGVTMLLPEELKREDSTFFQDRNTILKYLNERIKYEGDGEFLGTDYQTVKQAANRYNTKYVAVVSVVGIILKKDIDAFDVCYSIIYPPLITYLLYKVIKPERASYLSFELYDVTTGKKVFTRYKYFDTDLHTDLVKSEFYNLFLKFKGK